MRSLIFAITVTALACSSSPRSSSSDDTRLSTAPLRGDVVQGETNPSELDLRVARFLADRKGTWRDLNVPYDDGQVLFDLIVNGRHRSILEIGTSTGHSTIWLAWAASKTGGRVITIEIDEDRHRTAVANIEEAGLAGLVDARLADAHDLVKALPGPFDFVFSDADKDWYVQYFKDVDSKISSGGCIAAHNALNGFPGVERYKSHVMKHPDYQTRIDRTSESGFVISCKLSQVPRSK